MNRTPTLPHRFNLLHAWFSYAGRLTALEFWLKGIVPGILLGIVVVRFDAAADARGWVIFPYLIFSLWPLSALLAKRRHDWQCSRVVAAA
jgi:uncharacterized membrane protein YhaH (DUF805 family)